MEKEDIGQYEIMPYKEIVDLKKQIKQLQEKTGKPLGEDLLNSMSMLTKKLDELVQLFKVAAEEMRTEESAEDRIEHTMNPIIAKLESVIDQNKTIAEGIVAVADMVKPGFGASIQHPKPEMPDFGTPHEENLPPLGDLPPPPGPEPALPPLGAPTGGLPPLGDLPLPGGLSPPPGPPLPGGLPPPPGLPPLGDLPPPGGLPPPGLPPLGEPEKPKKKFSLFHKKKK